MWLLLVLAALGCHPPGSLGAQALPAAAARAGLPPALPTYAALPRAVTAADMAQSVPRIVISEVLADPLLHEEGVGDYLEIVQLSDQAVRLADLALLLPSGRRVLLERPAAPWLRAGEVAVLRSGSGPGRILVRGMRLPNLAGRVELWWRDHRLDVAQWLHKPRRWKAGVAMERRDPRLDGALLTTWRPATHQVDQLERGTPGWVQWPCAAVMGTVLASGSPCTTGDRARADAKTTKGRNHCGSGPAVGRWGGT